LLSVAALTACATAPPHPTTANASTAPRYVTVTGSHLAAPVDPRTGMPITSVPLQTVTVDEMRSTGQDDPAQALRMLVPIIR
jgi:hypothetical protein